MQLHRVLAAGLIGVYFCLLWREVMGLPTQQVRVEVAAAVPAPPGGDPAPAPPEPAVNVVDVAAAAATPALISQLIRLAFDERIVSIDDRPVEGSFAAGAWLAERFARPDSPGRGDYIDLTIQGTLGTRRVLVLLH